MTLTHSPTHTDTHTHTHTDTHTHTHWHTHTHTDTHTRTRWDFSGRVIGPLQRPLTFTTHKIDMPPAVFEPTNLGGERPQSYALDRGATEVGRRNRICLLTILALCYRTWLRKYWVRIPATYRIISVVVLLFLFARYITLKLGHDLFLLRLSWPIISSQQSFRLYQFLI